MRTVLFNAIALGELEVDFIHGPTAKISAKGAFINTENGKTHGWTTCTQWSKDTIDKLAELRLLMERDMSSLHFSDASLPNVETTIGSGSLKEVAKGLGERLGAAEDDIPQG